MLHGNRSLPLPTFAADLSLASLRAMVIAAILLITLAFRLPNGAGLPTWQLVLALAAYDLIVELARSRSPRLRSYGWVPFLDLPVAGVLYYLDADPGGPIFFAFYLAVITAAVCCPPRGTFLAIAAAVGVVSVVTPLMPAWSASPDQIRNLVARVAILAMVGIGAGWLVGRLNLQRTLVTASRREVADLAELDRLRTNFLSSVSHDLRTPLATTRAGLGMLNDSAADRLNPEERTLLDNVLRNVDRLDLMIDDLLTTNLITAGALVLDRESLDLREVVVDAVVAVRALLSQADQTLELDLPEPLPLIGDARRLEQVLVNLLANAHRHTAPRTRIAVAGRRHGGDVLLIVRDEGPGIPPAELDAVFERFYRGVGTTGGAGLGLSIARNLVELHGGRIWAESVPGEGAAFHVALPTADERRGEP